jgi:UDP-N-acetylmuramoyl-L-alanyl-D-glutamate--2,6-diaminopimelate ligase
VHPTRTARPLAALLADSGIDAALGPPEQAIEIAAIASDSRLVSSGALFVAIPGLRADGGAFVADAVRRGATAVVAERRPETPLDASIPLILVENARVALSDLAGAFNDHPSRALCIAGITGTDGKTTTATLLWHAWRAAGIDAASLTTVDRRTGNGVVVLPSVPVIPAIQSARLG